MDILINITLYMSCQAEPGFKPRTVRSKGERSPQLDNVCLAHFFRFVCLDVLIHSWQFRRGGISFTEVISSGHHVNNLLLYMFLMEYVSSSRDVVGCCFK